MMKTSLSAKISIVLGTIICSGLLYCSQQRTTGFKLIHTPFEIDPNFFVNGDSILVSGNNSNNYRLYSIDKRLSMKEIPGIPTGSIRPFLFKGRPVGLIDNFGDEDYLSTDQELNEILGFRKIRSIFSFNNGSVIIVQLRRDTNVYYYDITKSDLTTLLTGVNRVHSICLSEDKSFMVIDYDGSLEIISLSERDQTVLAGNSAGQAMSPYLVGTTVYFSNNSDSEFYQLYKIDLWDRSKAPELLYKKNHDLRLPKFKDNLLYFIEVVNSEYVLRCLNIHNGKVSSVTNRGVIYNYELQNDYIIASYTDAYTPKSLVKIHGTAITNITGEEPDLDILIQRKHVANLSPAFILSQRNYDKPAGVILYFHPDFTSDFSPRFDPILMSLCMANYIVIAPNYPMSSGFGKKYYNSGLPDAVRDMNGWKRYLKKTFDLNLYYLAVSSGNILMESSMAEESDGVAAFASLFGIPSQDPGYQVPGLYILGENDARVNSFNRRASIGGSHNLEVVIYPNEGHWFRYEKNTQDALNRIIDLYQSNN